MNIFIFVTALALCLSTFAGPGHGHGHGHDHDHAAPVASKEKIGEIGRHHVERLLKKNKLDKSWKNAAFNKSEIKSFSGKKEWVVTFKNEKGVKGKKLYIFLKTTGEFIAANFSGK
jgi:hypothetical protein